MRILHAGLNTTKKPKPRDWPSARALQYDCAISLELTNAEIKECLGVGYGTAKCQIHRLKALLDQKSRADLRCYFEEALVSLMLREQ